MGQVGLEWQVAGFGDFSGNGNETDMLMRNSNTGQFEIYDISNNQLASAASMGQVGLEWQVVGFGPIAGASAGDMLMRDSNTGAFEVYNIPTTSSPGPLQWGRLEPTGLSPVSPPILRAPRRAHRAPGCRRYIDPLGAI